MYTSFALSFPSKMDLRGPQLFFNPSNGRFSSLSCRFDDEPDRYRGDNRSHLLLYRESLATPSVTTTAQRPSK